MGEGTRGAREGPAARIALLLAVVAAFFLPATAHAHAVLVDSSPPDGAVLPTTPAELRLRFSEPVRPFGPGATLIAPSGQRVPLDAIRVDGPELVLPFRDQEPGTYVLRWRIVAEDTHPARGHLTFSVGAPSTAPAVRESEIGGVAPLGLLLQTVARWLHFLGLALGFGTLPFGARWRLANLGVAFLVVAEPIALLGQTASFDAAEVVDPDAISAALDSSFGRAMGVRCGGAFLLWVLIGIAQGGSSRAVPLALVVGWMLALFDGSSAHAASLQPTWLGLLVNALHTAAAALWTGGLAVLVLGGSRGEARRARLVVAGTLGASGAAMALSHLPRLADVTASAYGLALLAKLALVAGAVLLALLVRRRAELAALVAVLLLAGLLVSLPPPA